MPTATLAHDSPGYREAIARIRPGQKTNLLFAQPTERQKQTALSVLTEQLDYNVHQVNANSLVGDHLMRTQGNVREMFDTAQGEANILVFEKADALFGLKGEEDEDDEALIDYLFRRVKAFKGVVILCLQNPANIESARRRDIFDLIVEFQPTP